MDTAIKHNPLLPFTGSREPSRDYGISGTRTERIFGTIGSIATLVFAYNTGMLPEIQVPEVSGR